MLSACSSGDDGTDSGGSNGGGNNGGGSNNVSIDVSLIPNIGDQTTRNGVLFIRIASGNTASSFVATESLCPHQGGQLVFKSGENLIECQLHFAQYELDGDTIQGPQGTTGNTRDLRLYATSVSGSTLTATTS